MSPAAIPDRATVGVQRFRDARDARVDATERTGVDRVLCVLCQLHETRAPDGICQSCNNDFNEDELSAGGWPSSYGVAQEGWE